MDVILETSGHAAALGQAVAGLAYGARLACVGWYKECKGGLDLGEVAHFEVPDLIFSRACSEPNREHPRWSFARIQEACWRLLAEGKLRCERVVQPVVPFAETESMYDDIRHHPEGSVKFGVEF